MILLPARPSRAESNVCAQCPQERLRATQSAGEFAGIFGPASALAQRSWLLWAPARQSSAALPLHEPRSAMISRTRVGPSIGRVGARVNARQP
jgi:hypothetical protein